MLCLRHYYVRDDLRARSAIQMIKLLEGRAFEKLIFPHFITLSQITVDPIFEVRLAFLHELKNGILLSPILFLYPRCLDSSVLLSSFTAITNSLTSFTRLALEVKPSDSALLPVKYLAFVVPFGADREDQLRHEARFLTPLRS